MVTKLFLSYEANPFIFNKDMFLCRKQSLPAVGQLKRCIIYLIGLNNLFPVIAYKRKNSCYLLFQLQKKWGPALMHQFSYLMINRIYTFPPFFQSVYMSQNIHIVCWNCIKGKQLYLSHYAFLMTAMERLSIISSPCIHQTTKSSVIDFSWPTEY